MGAEAKFQAKFDQKKTAQAAQSKWKKSQAANFKSAGPGHRWNEQKPMRYREASVDVRPDWAVKGQITFAELAKLTTEVPEVEDVYSCGSLHYYDKAFDRVTPKTEKPLERIERAFYKVSTSDDPEIARLAEDPKLQDVRVYATDAILAVLMGAPRSAFSWDIVVNRVGDKLFLDKRIDSAIDYVTCNETANDFGDEDRDSINHVSKLTTEATFINQNFSQQVLQPKDCKEGIFSFETPESPFSTAATDGGQTAAPVGYKYRVYTLGKPPTGKPGDEEDNRIKVLARTEIDGVAKGKQDEDLLMRLYSLNEVDSKLTNGIDWRQKLDSQRGAVLATELKNNSSKLAKWTLQAMLAGADLIKLGYVSRVHPRDSVSHVILGTQTYKPKEFATQINLNINQAWGILKAIIDLCLQLEEGRYLLLKDPNKPVIRLYTLPLDAFEDIEEEEENAKNILDENDD